MLYSLSCRAMEESLVTFRQNDGPHCMSIEVRTSIIHGQSGMLLGLLGSSSWRFGSGRIGLTMLLL